MEKPLDIVERESLYKLYRIGYLLFRAVGGARARKPRQGKF